MKRYRAEPNGVTITHQLRNALSAATHNLSFTGQLRYRVTPNGVGLLPAYIHAIACPRCGLKEPRCG